MSAVLLDGNLRPVRRLKMLALSMTLRAREPGEAEMTLPIEEEVPPGALVRLAAPNGETGIYRAERTEADFPAGVRRLWLRHALAMLEDSLLPDGELLLSGAAQEVVSQLLGYQQEAAWVPVRWSCPAGSPWSRAGFPCWRRSRRRWPNFRSTAS